MQYYSVTATLVVRFSVRAESFDAVPDIAETVLTSPQCWQSFGEYTDMDDKSPIDWHTKHAIVTSLHQP